MVGSGRDRLHVDEPGNRSGTVTQGHRGARTQLALAVVPPRVHPPIETKGQVVLGSRGNRHGLRR